MDSFGLRVDGPINGGRGGGGLIIWRGLQWEVYGMGLQTEVLIVGILWPVSRGSTWVNHWNQGYPLEIVSCYGSV